MSSAVVVIAAAGAGLRMQSETPKQYLPLCGLTVIEQTLSAFLDSPIIRRIVVGIAKDDGHWDSLAAAQNPRISTVEGGNTRAETVINCLRAISAENSETDQWVMVHDAVRPCITAGQISALWESRTEWRGGALLALPVNDTLKRASKTATQVVETMERDGVWMAQTPQLFRLHELLTALTSAHEQGGSITDEASAMERAGIQPGLVTGSVKNLKITRRADLELAEMYIRAQQNRNR